VLLRLHELDQFEDAALVSEFRTKADGDCNRRDCLFQLASDIVSLSDGCDVASLTRHRRIILHR
jgi:hypothetical protein